MRKLSMMLTLATALVSLSHVSTSRAEDEDLLFPEMKPDSLSEPVRLKVIKKDDWKKDEARVKEAAEAIAFAEQERILAAEAEKVKASEPPAEEPLPSGYPFSRRLTARMIGLVEVPKLIGEKDHAGPPGAKKKFETKPIALYSSPSQKSAILFNGAKFNELTTAEHGYEEQSVVVYEIKNGWYKIGTAKGEAWLSPSDAGTFRSYEELLKDRVISLSERWDKKIHPSPTATARDAKLPADAEDSENTYAKVVAAKKEKGTLWLKVQLIPNPLDTREVSSEVFEEVSDEEGAETDTATRLKNFDGGWIPAYGEKNDPQFWFHSRGC